MFDPTREQARETFLRAWRSYRDGVPLTGMDSLVLDVILQHPEYHALLEQPARCAKKIMSTKPIPSCT